MALSKSAKYYRSSKKARKKKQEYDKKLNARPEQVKKRVESNRERRKAKSSGKDVKGKDWDHQQKKFISVKKNRGKSNEGGRKRVPNKNKGKR